MPIRVPVISINMLGNPPRQGTTQVNFRCIGPDKNMIDHAAQALGLTQAEFLRQVGVGAARFVIRERNKQLGEDTPKDGLAEQLAAQDAAVADADFIASEPDAQ